MSDPATNDSTTIENLNDQQWRRLGITQTFDRLLVEAVAQRPAPVDEVRRAVGASMAGGAAKFWEMSFPQIFKDLRRRGVLRVEQDLVRLDPEFAARLDEIIVQEQTGQSRVEPTPGVTLEDVIRQQEERAEREKAAKESARKRTARTRAKRTTEPRRRTTGPATPAPAEKAAPEPPRTPASKLFNSKRLNRLLDTLDTAPLSRARLAERVELSGRDMDRFLAVTDADGITRDAGGGMVELHWQGRELARTASNERRMALLELVKKLRARAEELSV